MWGVRRRCISCRMNRAMRTTNAIRRTPGEIAEHYPAADTIHLVVDNLSTHTRKALVDRFGEAASGWLWERFTVHYTPKHGSWLNQAQIEISLFRRQCLGTRRIGNIAALRRQTKAWNRRANRDKIRIQWKFTRKQARRT